MQIDLKGWGFGNISWFKHHCLPRVLNSVSCLREYLSQTDVRTATRRIPVMVNMASGPASATKSLRSQSTFMHHQSHSVDGILKKKAVPMDEYSDEDEDFQSADREAAPSTLDTEDQKTGSEEETQDMVDVSAYTGNLPRDNDEKARNCWALSNSNFRVRGKNFWKDKSKAPPGKHLMDLVAVDWFKDTKRWIMLPDVLVVQHKLHQTEGTSVLFLICKYLDNALQHCLVAKKLLPGSLLQHFVNGDDEFLQTGNSFLQYRRALGRQSVGSTPCLLGKVVDCTNIRASNYLEVDVDIDSSTVANGVLGLVIRVITSLIVDIAFLVQANAQEELPERFIGAV